MQEERSIANGTPKRESSGPVACGENEDSSRARGELRNRGCRDRSPSGNLDLWSFEDPDENFVQLINSVPITPITHGLVLAFSLLFVFARSFLLSSFRSALRRASPLASHNLFFWEQQSLRSGWKFQRGWQAEPAVGRLNRSHSESAPVPDTPPNS
jgi:hypothetical protein